MSFNINKHKINLNWHQMSSLSKRTYKCGYCEKEVASNNGYQSYTRVAKIDRCVYNLYLCPGCNMLTLMSTDYQTQFPTPSDFRQINHLPENISYLYDEAINSYKSNAFTGAVMLARKMLMNISVEHGAKEGLSFLEYIDYLINEAIVTSNLKDWVSHIKKIGNLANHRVDQRTQEEAKAILSFTSSLLISLYELPAMLPTPNAQGKA